MASQLPPTFRPRSQQYGGRAHDIPGPPPKETRLDAIARVQGRREEFLERLFPYLERKAPELLDDAELSEAWRELSLANLDAALWSARRVVERSAATTPDGEPSQAAENARLMARRGIPLDSL